MIIWIFIYFPWQPRHELVVCYVNVATAAAAMEPSPRAGRHGWEYRLHAGCRQRKLAGLLAILARGEFYLAMVSACQHYKLLTLAQ